MTQSPLLSIVVPAYRAADILEKNLPVLLAYLNRIDVPFEIVISDDGSPDGEAIEELSKRLGCIYCRHDPNLGKGAAIRDGMARASGKYRIFTDADIPYDPEAIGQILQILQEEGAPMVIGDRTLSGSVYFSEIPRIRKISSAFFTYFVGNIVTTDFYDTQCGIKGFSAAASETLFKRSRINGFTFDVEIIYIALKQGIPIRRIPVKLRNQELSTVRVFKHGILMFADLFRIKFNHLRRFYN